MKLSVWNSYWKFAAVGLLFVILAALGWLQYRWIGELSERERERRERNLGIAAENLAREFDRKITRSFLQLQVDPVAYAQNLPDNYAARYERWRQTALYPKLAKKIYVVGANENGAIRLSVYDENERRFEETEWSPPLIGWRSRIEEDLKNQPASGTASRLSLAGEAANDAIIIPIATVNLSAIELNKMDPNQPAKIGETLARQAVRRVGYTVILLDADYLKSDLLPSLIGRFFNTANESDAEDYDVIIRNRQSPAQIIYQSNRTLSEIDTESAARRDFFGIRLNEIENLIPVAQRPAISSAAGGLPASPLAGSADKSVMSSRIITLGGNLNSSAKNNLPVAASMANDLEPRWQIVAQPRNGSLEIAAEKMRRRNLLIGAGVLLLLGANGVLLIVLSNRAFNFARRQQNFVASVSHELRTPLAVIRSLSENLADGIVKNDEQMKQYGELINDEERRLSAMVEQMLDFAASEKNQHRQFPQKAQNVRQIIDAALEDYRGELQKSGFKIEKIIEPDLPPVFGDDDALRRAFGNLISNAVKYSGERRHLAISARILHRRQSAVVEISFADRGGGISTKDLSRIFKLFYRGQSATEAQIKGSGIGLSLVKQILEAHGGAISVESELTRGSVFIVTLPAAISAE